MPDHNCGDLPDTFQEQRRNNPDTALLVADVRLTRADVLQRIADAVDADLPSAQSGHFTHRDLAVLAHALGDDRDPGHLQRHHTKASLSRLVVDLTDADTTIDSDQDAFRKAQATRVWFAIERDADPDDDTDTDAADEQPADQATDDDQDQGSQARVQA